MNEKCKLYDLEKIKEEHGCKLCRYHHGDAECRYPFYQQVVIPAIHRNDVLCPGFERKGEIKKLEEITDSTDDRKSDGTYIKDIFMTR